MAIADKLALLADTKEQLRIALGMSKDAAFSDYVNSPLIKYSPTQLFAGGKQGALYEPWDISTLYQDAAGTVSVTANGDPVGLVLDKSGNGNHAVAPSSAARPIYRTDGILHWLKFDGVDDCLVTSKDITLATYAVGAMALGNNQTIFAYATTASRYPSGIANDSIYVITSVVESDWSVTPYVLGSNFVQFSHVGDGVNTAWQNGDPFLTPATTSSSAITGRHSIGVKSYSGTPNWYLRGNIYSIVCTSDAISLDKRQMLESYLAEKSGVAL